MCCYDAGLGTLTTKGGLNKLKKRAPDVRTFEDENIEHGLLRTPKRVWKVTTGQAVGWYIDENIEQLYRYLALRYNEGDHIYLFGFSRGAFTVHALAGLLDRCGLLPIDKLQLFPKTYQHFKEPHTDADDEDFKKEYGTRCCRIKFLGLWDTVKAYGYFSPQGFRKTRHNLSVDTARHALSLDERRSTFLHTTWGWGASDIKGNDPTEHCNVPYPDKLDVKEVWFAGDHSDVGGGWPENESGLAKQSLKWMIGEAWQASKLDELPLLINMSKYKEMFNCQIPPSPDNLFYRRHDRLADWSDPISTIGFQFVNRIPRAQLVNCPDPHNEFWFWPSGKREIDDTMRERKILFHETVEKVYGKSKKEFFEDWKAEGRLGEKVDIDSLDTNVQTIELLPSVGN
jgi:hypothetical protein